MKLQPIFPKDDPDDEVFECLVADCESLVTLAGEAGFVRHMLARHPEHPMARSIFTRLVEVQLMRINDAAELADEMGQRVADTAAGVVR